MRYLIVIFVFIIPVLLRAEPSEEVRKKYAEQICAAFQLQSLGRSTMAFYAFRDAYQYALQNGETPEKLIPFEALFRWYRKFGYSSGVAAFPSGCVDEYRSESSYLRGTQLGRLDPNQEKMVRDFLYGVGEVVSGTLCIAINPPLLGRAGFPLVIGGCKMMYNSVSCMIKDRQERDQRLKELNDIQAAFEKNFPKGKW
ncbi:MAG TPA: hypothetical protein DCE71_01125 [Parachlamydiales bacterium]|nr:hypothetical protein [Parachlamydiales bacterium]